MSLTGAKVSHVRFGSGVIEKMENGYISVRFEGMAETKEFVYPDAFQAFLRLTDATHEETLQAALAEKRRQEAEKLAAREDRLMKMRQKMAEEKSAGRARPKAIKRA